MDDTVIKIIPLSDNKSIKDDHKWPDFGFGNGEEYGFHYISGNCGCGYGNGTASGRRGKNGSGKSTYKSKCSNAIIIK